jgi:heme-degrading monooxygenase HmoA
MLHIYWEFRAKPEKVAEFEVRYGSHGDWAALFRRAIGFQGTTLVRDRNSTNRYLVTDIWENAASFAAFKKDFHEAYEQLDKLCAELTLVEKHFGDFEVV